LLSRLFASAARFASSAQRNAPRSGLGAGTFRRPTIGGNVRNDPKCKNSTVVLFRGGGFVLRQVPSATGPFCVKSPAQRVHFASSPQRNVGSDGLVASSPQRNLTAHHARRTLKHQMTMPKRTPNESDEEFTARIKDHLLRLKFGLASSPQRKADPDEHVASSPQRKTDPDEPSCVKSSAQNGSVASSPQRKTNPKKARTNATEASKASHLAKREARAHSSAAMRPNIPAGPAARAIRQLSAELGLDYGETIARVFAETSNDDLQGAPHAPAPLETGAHAGRDTNQPPDDPAKDTKE